MPLEPIVLDPTDPPEGATNDDLLIAEGCCPGCDLPTAFWPDDIDGEPGALTCRYCRTRFVVVLDGETETRHDRLRERLMGSETRRVVRVDDRRTRAEPPEWTARKAAIQRRVEQRRQGS